jgi:hypothetical protein
MPDRYYFHGDIAPGPQSETEDGIEATWFYDARLDEFVIVSPETTRANQGDIQRLRWELRHRKELLNRKFFRADDVENLFIRDPLWAQTTTRKKNRAYSRDDNAALRIRQTEHDRLLITLRCENCGKGSRLHADGKCLFEASEWRNA